jgi:uncharacterized membrane protein YbhN (UPF0104 family)
VAEASTGTPARRRLRRTLRLVLGLTAVILLLAVLWRSREDLADALPKLGVTAVAMSAVLLLLALLASMLQWRALLSAVGHRLPLLTAARLYFLTQIGKYLPGSVWPVIAQIELGREQGVPAARSGVAAALNLLVGIATGIVVGLACLVLASGPVGDYWWLLIPLVLMVFSLHPRVLQFLLTSALRLARRPTVELELKPSGLLVAIGWSLTMWLLFGLHIHVLVSAMDGGGSLLRSIGAYALAWVAGFVVFVAPAGAGARDLTLVVLLAPLGRPEALAVAVVSRVLSVAGDLVAAAGGIAAERWHRRASG